MKESTWKSFCESCFIVFIINSEQILVKMYMYEKQLQIMEIRGSNGSFGIKVDKKGQWNVLYLNSKNNGCSHLQIGMHTR